MTIPQFFSQFDLLRQKIQQRYKDLERAKAPDHDEDEEEEEDDDDD